MISKQLKGDIFKVGISGRYQFILVFDHLGMAMSGMWTRLQYHHNSLEGIKNPFVELSTPFKVEEGNWVQFIEGKNENHGLDDFALDNTLHDCLQWAAEHGVATVITNGIRDTVQVGDGIQNRKNTFNRIERIREICSQEKYDNLDITLISINDSFLRIQP